MPTLQELLDLTEFMVSESLEQQEFLLYVNFCLSDLSEIIKYEKDMDEYTISSNDVATDLPEDCFQIVSVVVQGTNSSDLPFVAKEVGVNETPSLQGPGRGFTRNLTQNIYYRWNHKLYVKSVYLDSGNSSMKVNVKYYGSLPTFDYDAETFDFGQTPPIREAHYHHAITHYVAYLYFSNRDMKEDAAVKLNEYLAVKNRIKDHVRKHRANSNLKTRIGIVR